MKIHSLTLTQPCLTLMSKAPGFTIHIYCILPSKTLIVFMTRVLLRQAWPSR